MIEHELKLEFTPNEFGILLKSPFDNFESSCGIYGLARLSLKETRLDILAVVADAPGTGQFREFIRLAKLRFLTIGVWDIWGDNLKHTLARYGFTDSILDLDDEKTHGMLWTKPK